MLRTLSASRPKKSPARAKTRAIKTSVHAKKAFWEGIKANPTVWISIAILLPILLLGGAYALRRILTLMPLPYSFVPSPNFDDRSPGAKIDCLVIHATVEPTTEGTMQIFLTPSRKVSAHFVVGRDGRVVQMVPVEKRAWHAGLSELEGARGLNDFSVGIEMVNLNDGKDPYPVEQMEAVAGIIRLLRSRYDIPDSRIVSHAQIALPAGRKNDPVGFDFEKVKQMAREGSSNDKTDLPPPSNDPERPENGQNEDKRF